MNNKIYMEQAVPETLETNFMPYAMSVIVSRALPEIDGFKPSHRKLLYTMYKMGLLTGARTKSANVVGQTMRLNPHGDAAIYDTLVRLSRGNGSLLMPFVDSKGNFGKVYSRDMAYAAPRYTEVKLDKFCAELFSDIDADAVDFADNYDGTMKEPLLLPTSFPNILVNPNLGIAVGMACQTCGFDLNEVCRTAIERIKNPQHDLLSTLVAPDFPTGGELIYDRAQLEEIYRTGRGSFKVRARWNYQKKDNLIEITEIPYTTTVEAIMDKITELVKGGKIREISDIRDESDKSGLKLTIDLKRGVDAEKLMAKLMKLTPLCDSFSCNFNILIGGMPRVMGVGEILDEWTAWRTECVRRKLFFDLQKKQAKLHLLKGLKKILLDIDRAIAIIRDTEEDSEVIPNLMIGFGIDEQQADFIAEIKLRNINKEHILKRLQEVKDLQDEIDRLEDLLSSKAKLQKYIIRELEDIIKKYPTQRHTQIVYGDQVEEYDESQQIEDYPVRIFLSREGYFKKITPQSLRVSSEQKFKEGDALRQSLEATNKADVIFLTNRCQAYKARLFEFDDSKASVLGDYLPQKLGMDEGESPIFLLLPGDYKGNLISVFENGKAAKVELSAFETKSNRRKLTASLSDKSPVVALFHGQPDVEIALYTQSRLLILNTALLQAKTTRSTQGVAVFTLKKNQQVVRAIPLDQAGVENPGRYRTRTLPAAGALTREEDSPDKQLSLLD
ncbi:MAG: DNA topoisomerase (ATP-hydrolyzing) subunit A [Clostridia bacterium]|nr:DNA topoisomerase (ATP-hydrolyzing) subunit A [Clostridia bacterium]MDY2929039.1 DNA topoisomerase (ATP-hydrolyzing) subunit A [Clostridiaceae bacterium]